ncbi:MAG: hypothetical protein Ct9H300mP12_03950 [Acidimicrobiales bacterium]|nr:MAG: hypothetical protein Ct9H300mP12_03950 [Acidimicrobiales bacterium]
MTSRQSAGCWPTTAIFSTTAGFDEWIALFDEDVVFIVMGNRLRGRDEVRSFIEPTQQENDRGRHILSEPAIEVDGDTALVVTDFVFVSRTNTIMSTGRYLDRCVVARTDGASPLGRSCSVAHPHWAASSETGLPTVQPGKRVNLTEALAGAPARDDLVVGDGIWFSNAELEATTSSTAAALAERSVGHGDRVAFQLPVGVGP